MSELLVLRRPRPPAVVPPLLSFTAGFIDSFTVLALFGLFVSQGPGSFVLAAAAIVPDHPQMRHRRDRAAAPLAGATPRARRRRGCGGLRCGARALWRAVCDHARLPGRDGGRRLGLRGDRGVGSAASARDHVRDLGLGERAVARAGLTPARPATALRPPADLLEPSPASKSLPRGIGKVSGERSEGGKDPFAM